MINLNWISGGVHLWLSSLRISYVKKFSIKTKGDTRGGADCKPPNNLTTTDDTTCKRHVKQKFKHMIKNMSSGRNKARVERSKGRRYRIKWSLFLQLKCGNYLKSWCSVFIFFLFCGTRGYHTEHIYEFNICFFDAN